MSGLTAERVRELLDYDPETGVFKWRVRSNRRVPIGSVAGSINTRGYRNICIDRKYYGAHRLAWLWVHGVWPHRYLDHVNRNNLDNRLANLREASAAQNAHNRRGDRDSKSGIKGVIYRPRLDRWEVNINHRYLGQFRSADEARAAYASAAAILHGEFARTE